MVFKYILIIEVHTKKKDGMHLFWQVHCMPQKVL